MKKYPQLVKIMIGRLERENYSGEGHARAWGHTTEGHSLCKRLLETADPSPLVMVVARMMMMICPMTTHAADY